MVSPIICAWCCYLFAIATVNVAATIHIRKRHTARGNRISYILSSSNASDRPQRPNLVPITVISSHHRYSSVNLWQRHISALDLASSCGVRTTCRLGNISAQFIASSLSRTTTTTSILLLTTVGSYPMSIMLLLLTVHNYDSNSTSRVLP